MLKKITAVLIAATMLFSMLGISAFAADFKQDRTEITQNFEKAVASAAAKLIGTDKDVTVSKELTKAVAKKVGSGATAETVKKAMSGFAVLNISELPESAQKIAESAEYKINKNNVVYIVVEIDKNPELLDMITLCEASKALYEKQNEFIEESGKDGLKANTYKHIVGELALHCAVYKITKAAGGANKLNPLYFFYESARECELNQNEIRGFMLIYIVGTVLISRYGK